MTLVLTNDFPSSHNDVVVAHIIYLTGGNPLGFRRNIGNRRLSARLRECVASGRLVVAASGGAMQFTNNVSLFRLLTETVDDVVAARDEYEALANHGRPLSTVDETRVLIGFAIQPFVAALLGLVTFPALDYIAHLRFGGRPVDPWDAALSVAFGAGLAGLFVTIVGALPVLAFLRSRGPISRTHVFTSGVVLGNVPLAIIALLAARQSGSSQMPGDLIGLVEALAFGSFFGAACAGAFWLVAGRHVGTGATPQAD